LLAFFIFLAVLVFDPLFGQAQALRINTAAAFSDAIWGPCHVAELPAPKYRRSRFAQAAAIAVFHSLTTAPRNWRNVLRDIK